MESGLGSGECESNPSKESWTTYYNVAGSTTADSQASKVAGSDMVVLIGVIGCIGVIVAAAFFGVKKVVTHSYASNDDASKGKYDLLFDTEEAVAFGVTL